MSLRLLLLLLLHGCLAPVTGHLLAYRDTTHHISRGLPRSIVADETNMHPGLLQQVRFLVYVSKRSL